MSILNAVRFDLRAVTDQLRDFACIVYHDNFVTFSQMLLLSQLRYSAHSFVYNLFWQHGFKDPDLNNVNLMCDIFKAGGKCVNEWTVSNFVEHAILKKITATGRAIAHKKQALLFVKCPSRPPGNWNLYPLVILPPTWHLAVKKNAYGCLLPCFNFSHHISTFHHN